jgi:hypothetical protein
MSQTFFFVALGFTRRSGLGEDADAEHMCDHGRLWKTVATRATQLRPEMCDWLF